MVTNHKSRRQTFVANRLWKEKKKEGEKRKKEKDKEKMDAWLCLFLMISLSDQQVGDADNDF